jgi:SAM-dependent methyltransferase
MDIKLINPYNKKCLTIKPEGLIDEDGKLFPLINGAYRFVNDNNYTSNFGFQWNTFQKTQIDGQTASNQSKERFFKSTGWDPSELTGKNILEVGSGAGRFTNVVLSYTKANLYSVDYSNAVEANFKNNGPSDRLKLFQASIYEMPFEKESFDKVFCFGVLQHTPDFKKSIQCLVELVKPEGELVIDFYPIKGWWTKLNAKYCLRPFTKKMEPQKLLNLIERNIDWMITVSRFFNKAGLGFLNRFIPICDIKNTLPAGLSEKELREWAILDTFDMFSPEYDNPQPIKTVIKWCEESGLKNVQGKYIKYGGNSGIVVKGIK